MGEGRGGGRRAIRPGLLQEARGRGEGARGVSRQAIFRVQDRGRTLPGLRCRGQRVQAVRGRGRRVSSESDADALHRQP